MKRIVIRADSSSQIGTGHIMRDLVLAKSFAESEVIFATRELDGNINHKITNHGYKLEILKSNKLEEFEKLIKKLEPQMVVIDSYDIDYEFEKALKTSFEGIKLMVLDDTYERHFCDIVLNHNISADAKKYKNLVPSGCELRCGARYTLLRDEFIKAKALKRKNHKRQYKKKVLIIMGGADSKELNIPILKALNSLKSISIDVLTIRANKNLQKLQNYSKHKPWINLHIDAKNVAYLMKSSDLAVLTPSVVVNEALFLDIPFVAIKIAKNQDDIYSYLKKSGFSVAERFCKKEFLGLVKKELCDTRD